MSKPFKVIFLNFFIDEEKTTTVVAADTTISSESNKNNNNAPGNNITVKELIQKHFDIPLVSLKN